MDPPTNALGNVEWRGIVEQGRVENKQWDFVMNRYMIQLE